MRRITALTEKGETVNIYTFEAIAAHKYNNGNVSKFFTDVQLEDSRYYAFKEQNLEKLYSSRKKDNARLFSEAFGFLNLEDLTSQNQTSFKGKVSVRKRIAKKDAAKRFTDAFGRELSPNIDITHNLFSRRDSKIKPAKDLFEEADLREELAKIDPITTITASYHSKRKNIKPLILIYLQNNQSTPGIGKITSFSYLNFRNNKAIKFFDYPYLPHFDEVKFSSVELMATADNKISGTVTKYIEGQKIVMDITGAPMSSCSSIFSTLL